MMADCELGGNGALRFRGSCCAPACREERRVAAHWPTLASMPIFPELIPAAQLVDGAFSCAGRAQPLGHSGHAMHFGDIGLGVVHAHRAAVAGPMLAPLGWGSIWPQSPPPGMRR